MFKRTLRQGRPAAVLLALALLLSTAAQALTPEDARALLETHYIDSISEEVLSQPTVADMLAALGDPYTEYYTPEDYAAFLSSMEDTVISGIGVSSQVTEDGLVIDTVYADSPAAQAGLRAGDLITAVDGTPLAGLDTAGVTQLLRGETGSRVSIAFSRDGQSRTAVLTRQEIVIPATSAEVVDGHIGLITCTTFGGDTVAHFTEEMTACEPQVDRWILDLTGNGGGAVGAAVDAAACFTGPAYLAYLRDSQGRYRAYATVNPSLTLSPVITLTDSATASASELFAAAVRDKSAGIVIGWRTYGKGVAQILLDQTTDPALFPDGDALKVTAYRFYSSTGNTTDTVGVIPHLMIDPNLAGDAARLLSASNPAGDTEGLLRVDFVWRWYIDLDQALSEELRPAFAALLEALPPAVKVWQGTGGSDGWARTSAASLAEAYGIPYTPRSFSDTGSSPYAAEIDALAAYLILEGRGDGTFRPEASLTRAELCTLLARALNCRIPNGESAFSDVSMDAWYGPSVNALAAMGLVSGTGDGTFRPEAPVTHEQLITILGRLTGSLNLELDQALQTCPEEALALPELAGYADWSRESVWLLGRSQSNLFGQVINLLWTEPDAIDPRAAATREETASLVYHVLSYLNILPV